jgi:hypothetical protein
MPDDSNLKLDPRLLPYEADWNKHGVAIFLWVEHLYALHLKHGALIAGGVRLLNCDQGLCQWLFLQWKDVCKQPNEGRLA